MVTILMMSAKLATPDNIKIFWSKAYYVIIIDYEITYKVLLRSSNYIVDVVVWSKFGNSSISVREVS